MFFRFHPEGYDHNTNLPGDLLHRITTFILATVAAVLSIDSGKQGICAGYRSVPNIVFILADDLGWRDLGCYGATKIKTPRIDRLAGEGLRFTDAHSVCGVCNPSRYSILSGTYFWHARRKPDYSLYFHDGQVTLPSLLKSAGYRTAALGKWHNGLGRAPEPDWNGELKPGPLEIGFDYFFGTPKTHNEPPLVFVENHRVVGLDPADPIRVDHSPRYAPHGRMFGGAKAAAARPDDRIDFILAEKAETFLAQQTQDRPFFLYLAFAAPHVPIDPAPEFRGKSQAGLYGDYIQQLDHCTGRVLDALQKHGHAGNTLVMLSSDNGGMYHRDALAAGHRCNGELLGQKTDAWEGGHRVPFIVRWPGRVPAGTKRAQFFSQVDVMATLAEAAGVKMPDGASPDGASELAALADPDHAPLRRSEAVFLGTASFALRQGDWLYIPKQGSGGLTAPETKGKPWGQPYAKMGFINSDIDDDGQIKPDAPSTQLYNLQDDLPQHQNVVARHPDVAARMHARMDELKLIRGKPAKPAKADAPPRPAAPPRAGDEGRQTSLPGWARDYHTLVSGSTAKRGHEWELGMMAERGGWTTGWYGAWWIQNNLQRQGKYNALKYVEHFRRQGVKNEFYFDAGEMGQFVALVHDGRLVLNQWEFPWYHGEPGELMWFGKDAFYRDHNPLRLKNYRDFGLPPWTLPDGSRVTSVYQLARTSFDGRLERWDYSQVRAPERVAKALNIDAFLARGPDPVPPEAHQSLGRIRSYDHSNPFLLGDFQVGVGMMLTQKPAFLHVDNYFDNELVYPRWGAFGPWSLENFRRFLRTKLDAATRQQLGLADLDHFDLKAYIRGRPYGNPQSHAFFQDPRWFDDPVWNLFVCSKLADADRLFRGLYAFCKHESRRQGAEVLVASNVIPLFPGGSLVSGALDVAHFEHAPAHQYGPIVVPTGLPPLGRLGGVSRIGAAVSKAGYCWLSAYVPKPLSGAGHENLHRVMAFDCLANQAVLDYNYQYLDGYWPGSDESAAWINCFIKNFSHAYGSRTSLRDTALVFPGQSLLGSISVFCMDPRPSLYDYLGWAQALTELHTTWDALPDDQLSAGALAGYRRVVLPSCTCLSDGGCAALAGYVRGGGRLLISGPAGERFGPEHFLWRRAQPQTLAARLAAEAQSAADGRLGAGRYLRSPDTFGRTFYEDVKQGRRTRGRAEIKALLDQSRTGVPPLVTTDASPLLGVFACLEGDGALAIDLVNYDLDLAADRLAPARNVQLVLRPPAGKRFVAQSLGMISPELRSPADPRASPRGLTPWNYARRSLPATLHPDGSLTVAVPEFLVFCTLSLQISSL